jgi:hypothetical protein
MLKSSDLLQFGEKSLDSCGFERRYSLEMEIREIYVFLVPFKRLSWEIAFVDLID